MSIGVLGLRFVGVGVAVGISCACSGDDTDAVRSPITDGGRSDAGTCRLVSGQCVAAEAAEGSCCPQRAVKYDFAGACWGNVEETIACNAQSTSSCGSGPGFGCIIGTNENGESEAWFYGATAGGKPGFDSCDQALWKVPLCCNGPGSPGISSSWPPKCP